MDNYPNQNNENYQGQGNQENTNEDYRDYEGAYQDAASQQDDYRQAPYQSNDDYNKQPNDRASQEGFGQGSYQQGNYQQYNPNQFQQKNYQQGQQNFQQGNNKQNQYQQNIPQRPKKQSDFNINGIVQETTAWIKAFFSPDYTESMVLAKKSNNSFGWGLIFLVYFLLNPIVALLSGLFRGSFYEFIAGLVSFLLAFLVAILVFAIQAGVLTLSQVIFKEYDSKRWFEAFNGSAVCLIPRIIALPVTMLLSAIPFSLFREISSAINIVAAICTYGLLYRFMAHNKDKKNAKWIITLLIALYVLLTGFGSRII